MNGLLPGSAGARDPSRTQLGLNEVWSGAAKRGVVDERVGDREQSDAGGKEQAAVEKREPPPHRGPRVTQPESRTRGLFAERHSGAPIR
jgi:hypothetical protein